MGFIKLPSGIFLKNIHIIGENWNKLGQRRNCFLIGQISLPVLLGDNDTFSFFCSTGHGVHILKRVFSETGSHAFHRLWTLKCYVLLVGQVSVAVGSGGFKFKLVDFVELEFLKWWFLQPNMKTSFILLRLNLLWRGPFNLIVNLL